MFKFTTHALKKVEAVLQEMDYTVRYEKGAFQSGYCVVQDRKVVVINKFFDTEGRINCLLDVLTDLLEQPHNLSEKSEKWIRQVLDSTAEETETPSN